MPNDKKKYQKMLTAKQCQFIDFLNTQFKFGTIEIIVHTSDPQDYAIKKITGRFDGAVDKTKLSIVDKPS